jgi:hypothetical protein
MLLQVKYKTEVLVLYDFRYSGSAGLSATKHLARSATHAKPDGPKHTERQQTEILQLIQSLSLRKEDMNRSKHPRPWLKRHVSFFVPKRSLVCILAVLALFIVLMKSGRILILHSKQKMFYCLCFVCPCLSRLLFVCETKWTFFKHCHYIICGFVFSGSYGIH